MPTDALPLQVKHFLLRACPTALLAADDIIGQAVHRDVRDEDVISMLATEYNADRHGWPKGPMPAIQHTANLASYSRPSGPQGGSYTDTSRFDQLRLAGVDGGRMGGGVISKDPTTARRRRLLINYYTVNKLPIEMNRVDHVIHGAAQDGGVTDTMLIDGLKAKYGLTELGEPTRDPKARRNISTASESEMAMDTEVAKLRHRATSLFNTAAPARLPEVEGIVDSYRAFGAAVDSDAILQSVRRSLGNCSSDGWPLDPVKRRLARLQRFFLSNDPSKLYQTVDGTADLSMIYPGSGTSSDPKRRSAESLNALVNSEQSDHALFLQLYYIYGKDEFGNSIHVDGHLKQKVSAFFSNAAPLAATDYLVFHYLAVSQRCGLCDEATIVERHMSTSVDTVIEHLQGQFEADTEGWPVLYEKRVKSRVLRYLMVCQPQDLDDVDTIVDECIANAAQAGGGSHTKNPHENLIQNYLHEKYGRREDGTVVLNTPAMRNWVIEFLEQYVPEEKVDDLTSAALSQRLHPEALKQQLRNEYATFTPFQHKLRAQLKHIYARAAPTKDYQIHQILKVKRAEHISDRIILKTVCERLGVNQDGWPADLGERLRTRLRAFFTVNDPPRLIQVEMLIGNDERTEDEIFEDLYLQYGKDELGNPAPPPGAHSVQFSSTPPPARQSPINASMGGGGGEVMFTSPRSTIGPTEFVGHASGGGEGAVGPSSRGSSAVIPVHGGTPSSSPTPRRQGAGARETFNENLTRYSWLHDSR